MVGVGIVCPKCSAHSQVMDSRPRKGFVYRRRKCERCAHQWPTIEVTLDGVIDLRRDPRATKHMRHTLAAMEKSAAYLARTGR